MIKYVARYVLVDGRGEIRSQSERDIEAPHPLDLAHPDPTEAGRALAIAAGLVADQLVSTVTGRVVVYHLTERD